MVQFKKNGVKKCPKPSKLYYFNSFKFQHTNTVLPKSWRKLNQSILFYSTRCKGGDLMTPTYLRYSQIWRFLTHEWWIMEVRKLRLSATSIDSSLTHAGDKKILQRKLIVFYMYQMKWVAFRFFAWRREFLWFLGERHFSIYHFVSVERKWSGHKMRGIKCVPFIIARWVVQIEHIKKSMLSLR